MNTSRIVLTFGGLLLAASANLHAASCSSSSIAGKWAFTSNGTLFTPSGPIPVAAVANLSIDVYGNIEGCQTRSLAGQVADEIFTGTLSITPECSSEAKVDVRDQNGNVVRSTTLHLVFDDNSRSARGIFTSLVLPNGTGLL